MISNRYRTGFSMLAFAGLGFSNAADGGGPDDAETEGDDDAGDDAGDDDGEDGEGGED